MNTTCDISRDCAVSSSAVAASDSCGVAATCSSGVSALTALSQDELAQMMTAYNQVTQRLEESHRALQVQVDRLQEQLASKDVQLQRSKRLAALGEMAAGIAHEVRNPLAAIQLYADMIDQDMQGLFSSASCFPTDCGDGSSASSAGLKSDSGSQVVVAARDNARRIKAAVRGLDAVVRDVLAFARDMVVHPLPVTAEQIFGRALAVHQAELDRDQIQVRQQLQPPHIPLDADPDLLHQAMLNLIRNAAEAMRERPVVGQPKILFLSAKKQRRQQVVFTIRDTGPGLAAGDIDRLFNPFFTTRHTGTGLGLAIVHRIIDAHGGTITPSNHPDGGAVFEMTLPVRCSGLLRVNQG